MGEFKMPSLGADMDAGTLVEWKVKPGDRVKRGDVVAVVDTHKGAIDVEIWQDGVIARLVTDVGATVPVGTVLALLEASGEAPAGLVPEAPPAAAPPPVAPPPISAAPPPPAHGVRVSPAARSRAKALNVDLAALTGTGPSGAITIADVERAVSAAQRPPEAKKPSGEAAAPSPMRVAIAAAMARSKREIPHYYLSQRIPLQRALAFLARTNDERPVAERVLPVALLLKAVALGLREFPELNGYFKDERHVRSEHVHLGVAIALRQGGLIAPAIHDADRLPLAGLMQALTALIQRARQGGLRSSELADGTVTVTNVGDAGADAVYGVIYPPQVAIVGFGRVQPEVVAEEDRVAIRPVVHATLAADHRVSDGHRGGLFLLAVSKLLQHPEAL